MSAVEPLEVPTKAWAADTVAGRPPADSPTWRQRYTRAFSFLVMLTFLLLSLVFVLSHGQVADPDIWWHLHNADYLVQNHSLPRFDTYSFTVAGHPWINHEWLAELPYYVGWRAIGLRGIDAVTFLILSLIFLGVLHLCHRESGNYKASILACCCCVFLASVSFGPRTILFGYACLVLLLILLQRFRQRGPAALWAIPPLFCLWVNTHGSWLLGLILFSITIAAGFVDGSWGSVDAVGWTKTQRKQLVQTWCASIAALFVNPFGYRLVFYPFDLAFRQKLNVEHVQEWVSVNFHDQRGKIVLAVLVVLLVSLLLRSSRWTLTEVGIVLFALYSGLTYIRFLVLLGIVLAPVLARVFDFIPRYREEVDTPTLNLCVILLMIAGVVHYWPKEAQMQASLRDQYPVGAVAYLQEHPPSGHMLNFYLWGGYLNWKDSRLKVFLDSRVDIFEYSGVLKDYLDLLGLYDVNPTLDKYRIQYVLFPTKEPLTYALEHDARWRTVYRDDMSVLFERVDKQFALNADEGAGIQKASTPANAAFAP